MIRVTPTGKMSGSMARMRLNRCFLLKMLFLPDMGIFFFKNGDFSRLHEMGISCIIAVLER